LMTSDAPNAVKLKGVGEKSILLARTETRSLSIIVHVQPQFSTRIRSDLGCDVMFDLTQG